jgi:hypothetical protein
VLRRHHGGNTSCRDRGVAALNGGWWGGGGSFFRRVHYRLCSQGCARECEQGEHGGGLVLVGTAEEGFGVKRQGVKRTREGLTIGEQGPFWQGFRSRLGARLGTLAYGVRAEPSARVTKRLVAAPHGTFHMLRQWDICDDWSSAQGDCRACFLLALCS